MTTPKYNIGIVLKKIKNNKYFALLPDLKEKTKKYSSIIFSLISLSFLVYLLLIQPYQPSQN